MAGIVPTEVRSHYDRLEPFLVAVRSRVRDICQPYCEVEGYLFTDRLKSLESLAEKVESARFKSLDDIDDLYAATIVVGVSSEHDEVVDFLTAKFELVDLRRRYASRKSPEEFRFDGTRLYGRLATPTDLQHVVFEIQVQTAFEHAWSRTMHSLTYKGGTVDWRRSRVGSLLRALSEHADLLLSGFDDVTELLDMSSWPPLEDRRKIVEFFKARIADGRIPSEVVPDGWTRFAENVYKVVVNFSGSRSAQFDHREPLKRLADALTVFDQYLKANSGARFPRSVSLLQVFIGVVGSSDEFSDRVRATDYYAPISENLLELFPDLGARDWPQPFVFG